MPITPTRFFRNILIAVSCLYSGQQVSAHNANPEFVSGKTLEFIRNQNQWDAKVKYKADLPGGQLYFLNNALMYDFQDPTTVPQHPGTKVVPNPSGKLKGHAYKVIFLGANQAAGISAVRKTPGFRNYFKGNDASRWASDVPAYQELEYKNIYPGTDLKFYEHHAKLKYDFILQPGGDPSNIKMQYDGAEKLSLKNGDLVVQTSVNTVTEQKPYAYQIINGKEQEVPCGFLLKNNTVSFEFPKGYRKDLPLVIDPVLIFSTLTGAVSDNWGFTATYDQAGNLYAGGIVFGSQFPVSPGAYQTNFAGGDTDIAIIKYNPNLSGQASRVYATFLGGNEVEAPHSLVVNSTNELLILGTTSSNGSGFAGFPTTVNAHDRSFNGGTQIDPLTNSFFPFLPFSNGSDLIISKLSPNGNALLASTFLGGSGNDGLLTFTSPLTRNYGDQFRGDIITDAQNNVYIASSTFSTDFPAVNGFQATKSGNTATNDAVVCKLSPNLNTLIWSSFLGGTGVDAAYSVQIDTQQNVYICGGTTSANLPNTAGGLKPANTAGNVEGFVAKISSTGNTLMQASYIGAPGMEYDQTYFVQVDASDNVYLLGQSAGVYPIKTASGATSIYQKQNSRQFIQKLNPALTTSIFSTTFGSVAPLGINTNFNISPTAFLVDNCERIFVSGWGGNSNANAGNNYVGGSTFGLETKSTNPADKLTTDGSDIYLMQLSRNAAQLDYAVFFGANQPSNFSGEHVDGGTSRFDKRGFIYQAVCGACTTSPFPTTPNAFAQTDPIGTNCNIAAFKLDFALVNPDVGTAQTICANSAPIQLTGTPAGGTWTGPGVTPGGLYTPNPAQTGQQTVFYEVTVGTCIGKATKTVIINPIPDAAFSGLDPLYCNTSQPVTLTPVVGGGSFTGPGVQGNTWTPALAGPGNHQVKYEITANGCTATIIKNVQVQNRPAFNLPAPFTICAEANPITLSPVSPAGGVWSGPGVTATGLFTPNPALTGPQKLLYTIQLGSCTFKDSLIVTVTPKPNSSFNGLAGPYCISDAPVTLTPVVAGGTFSGPGVQGNTWSPALAGAGNHQINYTISQNGCTVVTAALATVSTPPTLDLGPDETFCITSGPVQLTAPTPSNGTWLGNGVSPGGLFTAAQAALGSQTLTYTVMDGNCTYTKTKTVTVEPLPEIKAQETGSCGRNAENNLFGFAPLQLKFENLTANSTNFIWNFGDNTNSNEASPEHTYQEPGIYTVMLTGINGNECATTAEVFKVEVKPPLLPNLITPDNDRKNDYFMPQVTCKPYTLKLYNRWGNKVFEQENYAGGFNGSGLAGGVYFYHLKASDGNTWKGTLEIVK